MEDEEKSGLIISLGNLVSCFPLCCAFGIPELFFGGVRRLAGPQLPHCQLFVHMGALHHTHALHHIDAHAPNTYIAILRKMT
jgi:hypothetical protein